MMVETIGKNNKTDVKKLCALAEKCIYHLDINDDTIRHKVSVSILTRLLREEGMLKEDE